MMEIHTLDGQSLWRRLETLTADDDRRYPRIFPTPEAWATRKQEIADACRRSVGLEPWPPRCDLSPRLVRVVDGDGYRIELLVLQTLPGILATVWLYLPHPRTRPVPAIVHPHGHWGRQAFSAEELAQLGFPPERSGEQTIYGDSVYNPNVQPINVALVQRGFAVLTYDALCQGERPPHRSYHNDVRAQALLLGHDISGDMFWESVRMIDYLETRPEIDAERIGMTGYSGGGFNAVYTALMDPRVRAIASGGFAVSFGSLIRRRHAGCCAYHCGFAETADLGDACAALSPRPLLIFGGGQDGALACDATAFGALARRLYAVDDAADRVDVYLDPDAGHLFTARMRQIVATWFDRWLGPTNQVLEQAQGTASAMSLFAEGSLRIWGEQEPRGSTYGDHLRRRWASLCAVLPRSNKSQASTIRRRLAKLLNYPPAEDLDWPVLDLSVLPVGKSVPWKLPLGSGLAIVLSLVRLQQAGEGCVLHYGNDTVQEGRTEALAVFVYPRGCGPTTPDNLEDYLWHSLAQGRHLFAEQICDLGCTIRWLYRCGLGPVRLETRGARQGAQAICLAAIEPALSRVDTEGALVSWVDFLEKDAIPALDLFAPGILTIADLPILVTLHQAKEGLSLIRPVDAQGVPLSDTAMRSLYTQTFAQESGTKLAGSIKILM